MDDKTIKEIIRRAVKIANDAGLQGQKISIHWEPSLSAAEGPYGNFSIITVPRSYRGAD